MNNRAHIDNELRSIAPGLVSVSIAMPYTLPQDYFSTLASELLSSIKNETEPLSTLSRVVPYTVPTGYFEQLPEAILQKLHFVASESEPVLWNELSKTIPYKVPTGYFESLPAIILQKTKKSEQAQNIPEGYFDALPDLLLAKVRKLDISKELEEVAPTLNTISKQTVQYVPEGYFENLQPLIKKKEQSVPVVSFRKKNNWLKYAVAASIALLLSFGAYFFFTNSNTAAPSIANQPTVNVINEELANLDAATIEDYLKTNNAIVQTALPDGGVEELSNGNLDELLQGFTDQQLKKHIEETPELPTVSNQKSHT